MKNSKQVFYLAIFAAAGIFISGCGSSDPSLSEESSAAIDDSPADAVVDTATVAALTGEDIEAGSLSRPSLSAKIDNHPSARPQVGLGLADIVFEELVEGGLTRYVAVWHSELPPEIGPVRSVRPMDPEIVSPFGGVFAYSGGQVRFIQMMQQAPVYNAIHGQPDTEETFYRTSAKVAPHNVLVKAPDLIGQHLDLVAPGQQFSYASDPASSTAVAAGNEVKKINPRFSGFSSPTWEWDEAEQAFVRFQTNGAADSASSGEQLTADNILVLQVSIEVVEDIPTTRLVSQGSGWIATGGFVEEILWAKTAPESKILLTTTSGDSVLLGVGNTWIELIPNESSDVEAGILTLE